ncbi:MAG: SusD/RagB family nutrient-binding outer membrane lipoprotein [Chitinophagaceae bacterium]|nr:MAG: SusD/RagB family nutrient-binding outer membrane lipoprotein [Chitinophagaceae bacterium]
MKKIYIIGIAFLLVVSACTKQQFSSAYSDPSKLASTTIDRQFAGFLSSNLNYVMYHYWDYFVVYQNTLIPWSQTAVTLNTSGRYLPGAAAISDFWGTYYGFMAQYKELLRLNSKLSDADQKANRIYIIAATIYYYDYTQKAVDLWGDIPWSGAGLLGTKGGNFQAATTSAKYDDAASIYTKMLDDLKGFSDELNSISVPTSVETTMQTEDFINHGDVNKWKKYCNSLRVRLLTRISGVPSFQSRVSSELASITGNPTTYPVVATDADNIMVKVVDIKSAINNGSNTGASSDFLTGLIGWGEADRANKQMIDLMNANSDPRLRAMFEPGTNAAGVYNGLDPTLPNTAQSTILNAGTIARYNRSTLTQNNYIPGILIDAAETELSLAEYYLNAGNAAAAEAAYNAGITQSINYYYWLRTLSTDNVSGPLTPLGPNEIANYLASPGIAWSGTNAQKLNLIATQKWINYSVLQPMECWSELRRLKLPVLTFLPDNGVQKLPPNRWLYPTNEQTYNTANYEAVASKDNLSTKIFWDVK